MDLYYYLGSLLKRLNDKGLLQKTYDDFMIQTEDNNQKIQFTEDLLKKHNLLPNYEDYKQKKCNKKAEEFRILGNELYKNQKFYEALLSYNNSLCYSTKDSPNIGIAFANRSAVYLSMGQYEKCIENIELAKYYNYPKDKIDKLNKRGEDALEKLNSCPDPNQKLIKYEKARERFMKPKLMLKPKLSFYVADCLEVKTSPEFGRHLVTNQDLSVGSVIVVENPFTKILEQQVIYERCANCMERNLLNLIPCFNCCSAMFCSEDCHEEAQKKFHKFECELASEINQLLTFNCRLALRTYLEGLNICGTPRKLKKFLDSIKDSNATILDFEYTDEASFRKNSLHSVDALVTNENSPYYKPQTLFQYSTFAAITCDLMLNHSTTLKFVLMHDADKRFFREFIFKHSQISAVNSHSMYCKKLNSVDEEEKIGAGSYPFCSLINHSCAPNIIRETFETEMYIVVRRPIKKGGQIFDNYGFRHTDLSKEERQENLLRQYRFHCNCEACQKDYQNRQLIKYKKKYLYANLFMLEDKFARPSLDVAADNFKKLCTYIDKLDESDYPSCEILALQTMIMSSLTIFTTNEIYEN